MDLDKVNSLKEKGNNAYLEQKYDEALDFYAEALELIDLEDKRTAAILHSNIAQTYLDKKDYLEAIKNADKALKLDSSFMKSNLRRAIANVELGNLTDAMNDLRLIFSLEPNNNAAKDLMRRCSDSPRMKLELHEIYAKCYLRSVLKKLGTKIMDRQTDIRSDCFQNALLRQTFLSMNGLKVANYFFRETFIVFNISLRVLISFLGWIPRQFMCFKFAFSPITIMPSDTLFKLLYHLFQPGTFSLVIVSVDSINETVPLDKYSEIMLFKENMLAMKAVDATDLKSMNHYSNDLTRLLYTPDLANFKENMFPKANALIFEAESLISDVFLKLWKQNEWPIKTLSFIHGVPDLQVLKRFNGVVSRKVNEVFIKFAENNHQFDKHVYNEVCSKLLTLKSAFPELVDVTITHMYDLDATEFPTFVQDMSLIHEACATFSTKPEWCSKLKVVIFAAFEAFSYSEFKMFDVKLLEQAVESFCQKHPDMKIHLKGPRSYDTSWADFPCVHAVVEFENEAAQFELAFLATMEEE